MRKVIQLISNFFTRKTCTLLWKYMFTIWTWWRTKLYKIFKIFKFWKKKATRKKKKISTIWKKIMFNGFKKTSFRCKLHVQEKILPKNMFSCPLKFIFEIFGNFCISSCKLKYSFTIMYECENSPPTHELS